MSERQPSLPHKPLPPLVTETTTIEIKGGGELPSGRREPKEITVVTRREVTPVKPPPPPPPPEA
jgi:hypothetical protein